VHALAELQRPLGITLVVGHVNHGLRGSESEADEAHVEALARKLGVSFASERVQPAELQQGEPSRTRPTMQEAARRVRRAALERLRVDHGCDHIATAHHADDQAETVLMRLLRGSGPDSLGGIRETGQGGVVLRPLLDVDRAEIETFACLQGLRWREDASNADTRYTRNRIRAELIPSLVRDFNPRLLRAVGDLAEAQRRDTEWVDSLVAEEARLLFDRGTAGTLRISARGWTSRPEALARRLVKLALIEMGGGRDVSRAHLLRILAFLREGRVGSAIELPGRLQLERESTDVFVLEEGSVVQVAEERRQKSSQASQEKRESSRSS
jgi:tRNA(Ile)-lysidine synthase